jgi:TonB family protein
MKLYILLCLFGITSLAVNAAENEPEVNLDKLYENVTLPLLAERFDIEGDVLMEVEIDDDGEVVNYKILRSDSEILTRGAIEALNNTIFEPALEDGKEVGTTIEIPFRFRLNKNSRDTVKRDNNLPKVIYIRKNESDTVRVTTGDKVELEYKLLNANFEKLETRNVRGILGDWNLPQQLENLLYGMAEDELKRVLVKIDDEIRNYEYLKPFAESESYLVFVIKLEKILKIQGNSE